VRDLLRGTFMEDAPILPVDSVTGSGLETLRDSIVAVLKTGVPEKDREGTLQNAD